MLHKAPLLVLAVEVSNIYKDACSISKKDACSISFAFDSAVPCRMATHSMRTANVVDFGRVVIVDTKKMSCTGLVCFARIVDCGLWRIAMIGSAELRSQ